jgi:hypothetical protein
MLNLEELLVLTLDNITVVRLLLVLLVAQLDHLQYLVHKSVNIGVLVIWLVVLDIVRFLVVVVQRINLVLEQVVLVVSVLPDLLKFRGLNRRI